VHVHIHITLHHALSKLIAIAITKKV